MQSIFKLVQQLILIGKNCFVSLKIRYPWCKTLPFFSFLILNKTKISNIWTQLKVHLCHALWFSWRVFLHWLQVLWAKWRTEEVMQPLHLRARQAQHTCRVRFWLLPVKSLFLCLNCPQQIITCLFSFLSSKKWGRLWNCYSIWGKQLWSAGIFQSEWSEF